jgi:hypothetical protein
MILVPFSGIRIAGGPSLFVLICRPQFDSSAELNPRKMSRDREKTLNNPPDGIGTKDHHQISHQ